ncbi:MAG: glycoside hydrolase family 15 protein [Nocardioides sp.]|uniref:glycoside hydrolase family 15 protein n=1 Tax=Nocardioides sp. TaxID=35761 RepID=UPI0039E40878
MDGSGRADRAGTGGRPGRARRTCDDGRMALPIADYALLSDCNSGALVGRDGSIDWLCLPRYDSASMFAALLGDERHGRWLVAPTSAEATSERRYLGDSFTLVTTWSTPEGQVEVVDTMPRDAAAPSVIRRIRGLSGSVQMRAELTIRFGYASALPWVRRLRAEPVPTIQAVAGPDAIVVRGVDLRAADHAHSATFTVTEGEVVDHTLSWFRSHRPAPAPIDVEDRLEATERWWEAWSSKFEHHGGYAAQVARSLLVLRALTHEGTGGVVAAPTTSLPELFGGTRNWDYRYVWLRDASLALSALIAHGYRDEAEHWRGWLLRAIAGDPADVQIMYGISGERFLPEYQLDSLPGYDGATPVRIGNGASTQFQADVIGEVMVALHDARMAGLDEETTSWSLQRALLRHLGHVWHRPDQGIWEIRGPARHFTHSRAMVWAAYDRAIRAVEEFDLPGPVELWRAHREELRAEIEDKGFNADRNCFTQHYDTTEVDASLLQLPQVGFVAANDPRMLGTVAAIEQDLMDDGLLLRYRSRPDLDGLPSGEYPFLACSFWLVEQYAATGELDRATMLMDRLCGLASDVGLLSEEYAVASGRQAGNAPQALSHLTLVRAADAITRAEERPSS